MRLPARGGERPAGVVSGDGAAFRAFNFDEGDLGWRTVRGFEAGEDLPTGLLRTSLVTGEETAAFVVRVYAGDLEKFLLRSPQKSAAFDRFGNCTGAMFSVFSASSTSEAFRLIGEDAMASTR